MFSLCSAKRRASDKDLPVPITGHHTLKKWWWDMIKITCTLYTYFCTKEEGHTNFVNRKIIEIVT